MPGKNKTSKQNKKSGRSTRRNKPANGAKGPSRKALSVADIRGKFAEMDNNMRNFIKKNNLNNPKELSKHVSRQWQGLFQKPLSNKAAKDLAAVYTKAHGGQRGGQAPLDYVMRPGMPGVATYAVFPTEAGADVKASSHLDVYYNSAIGRSCGTENTTAIVPKDMGSNHVAPVVPAKGGARKRTRKHRGGDFMTTMDVRAFVSENPSNPAQRMSEAWMGQPASIYDNGRPEAHGWATVSSSAPAIDPRGVSIINSDITRLANPSPYPAVKA
jgi:hypothetical protein